MVEFRNPEDAFEDAIKSGRLSLDGADDNFVGYFMYMGTVDGKDTFKNIDTRKYID